jgi:hypothetical protein
MPSRFFSSLRRSFSSRATSFFGDHRFQVAEACQAALDGVEVGQEATEPSLVHVIHPAAGGLFGNHVLRLTLRSDE